MFTKHRNLRMTKRIAVIGFALAFGLFLSASTSASRLALAPNETTTSKTPDFRLQPSDSFIEPLDPIKARSVEERDKIDAVAHYLAGKLKESRNDFRGAYAEYKKAVALDPSSVDIYRVLVPLAFNLKQNKDAMNYALRAVELDPNDYRLLHQLGRFMAQSGNLAEAVRFLEKAAESNSIIKESSVFVRVQRDLALLYQSTGEKEKSADAFEIVLDALINPDKYHLDFQTRAALIGNSASTYELIGQAFLDADRIELAIKAFEAASKNRRGNPGQLSYSLARVYLKSKQFEKAHTELQKYFDAQLQSKGRDAYKLLAEILKALERSNELLPYLEQLAEKDARNYTLQYFLADQYVAADRLDEAESVYKNSLAKSPEIEGFVGLASVYRRQQRADELLAVLSRAMGAARSSEELMQTLTRLETELKSVVENQALVTKILASGKQLSEGDAPKLEFAASLMLAHLASEAKVTDDVVHFYRFALKARPALAGLILEELGTHFLTVDRYEDAIETYQEAVNDPALSDNKPNFLFRLSQAQEFHGDTDAALKTIREARGLYPGIPLLHYQEAWISYHARRWDEAIPIFEEIIEKYPQATTIIKRCRFSLSNLYVQRGEISKGEKILEEFLAENPDDPSVNNDLGYLYADQGKNLEQAEKMIRKAITAEPENAAYLDSMGWVLFKLERYEESAGFLEKAVSYPNGGDATIWNHLGNCYEKLQKADQAKEAWQKAWDDLIKQSQPDKELLESLKVKLKIEIESIEAQKPQ